MCKSLHLAQPSKIQTPLENIKREKVHFYITELKNVKHELLFCLFLSNSENKLSELCNYCGEMYVTRAVIFSWPTHAVSSACFCGSHQL